MITLQPIVDPSLPPGLQFDISMQAKAASYMSLASVFQMQKMGFDGDPMVGVTIPNTTYKWENMTQVQCWIYQYYINEPGGAPANLQQILDSNPGPKIYWNQSYTEWGLVKQA